MEPSTRVGRHPGPSGSPQAGKSPGDCIGHGSDWHAGGWSGLRPFPGILSQPFARRSRYWRAFARKWAATSRCHQSAPPPRPARAIPCTKTCHSPITHRNPAHAAATVTATNVAPANRPTPVTPAHRATPTAPRLTPPKKPRLPSVCSA